MKNRFTGMALRWVVVSGLVVMMGLTSLGYAQAASLTENEIYWLTYMREEEKLARDVYLSLYEKWQLPIFANIAKSEQKHMDAIKTLLVRYGVEDPVTNDAPGAFTNSYFAGLYADLTGPEQGSASVEKALQVGVFIEETDIIDLGEAMDASGRRDIDKVYGNLLRGSLNHLDAFQSHLPSD